jgi:hypothetical protein
VRRLLPALLLLAGAARAEPVTLPGPEGIMLKARLPHRPSGAPVAPAIVALRMAAAAPSPRATSRGRRR